MASITFESVTKRYDDGSPAVSELDLAIADGEFLVLVGPSGCGKSTALRMIAGLEEITSGRLLIGDKVANEASPRERNIAMVFQSYALYPHLSVAGNIGFGLKVRGIDKREIDRKIDEVARVLELSAYLDRRPGQLSGGQRQRVAMGRALVRSPNAFLMDEPLSNLDARLRGQMRAEIAELQKRTGVTTVYVTHDQVEAMTMGHRVAVMSRGTLQQLAPPRRLYDAPANLFVAGFIGSPGMNFLAGTLVTDEGVQTLRIGPHRFPVEGHRPGPARRTVIVGLRPESFRIGAVEGLQGTAAFLEDLGATVLLHVDLAGEPVIRSAQDVADDFSTGALRLRVVVDPGRAPRIGEAVTLVPDPTRLHLFDPETGLALAAR